LRPALLGLSVKEST